MNKPVQNRSYTKGATIRCTARFRVGGVLTDPTTVIFKHQSPTATVTKTYPSDPEIERDSAGVFHIEITANESGTWDYRWEGTGAAKGAAERSFLINPSKF